MISFNERTCLEERPLSEKALAMNVSMSSAKEK